MKTQIGVCAVTGLMIAVLGCGDSSNVAEDGGDDTDSESAASDAVRNRMRAGPMVVTRGPTTTAPTPTRSSTLPNSRIREARAARFCCRRRVSRSSRICGEGGKGVPRMIQRRE